MGGRSHQEGRDRKFPGTEHSAVCNIPASHSAIEGNLRLITGQVGQLEGGRTPVSKSIPETQQTRAKRGKLRMLPLKIHLQGPV